jgi:membrane associated rhomboid family serine protease
MPSFSNKIIFNQKSHFLIFRAKPVNIPPPPPRKDFGVNSEGQIRNLIQYILIHDSLIHLSFNCFFGFSFRSLFYDTIPEFARRGS